MVPVAAVEVRVRFHRKEQKRLDVIGQGIAIAIGIGNAVVVLVVAGEDPVWVVVGRAVVAAPRSGTPVGPAVVVVVVLDKAIGDFSPRHRGYVVADQLAGEIRPHREQFAPQFEMGTGPLRGQVVRGVPGGAARSIPPAHALEFPRGAMSGPAVWIAQVLNAASKFSADAGAPSFKIAVNADYGAASPSPGVEADLRRIGQVLDIARGAAQRFEVGQAPARLFLGGLGFGFVQADQLPPIVVAHHGFHFDLFDEILLGQIEKGQNDIVAIGTQFSVRLNGHNKVHQFADVDVAGDVLALQVAAQVKKIGIARALVGVRTPLKLASEPIVETHGRGIAGVNAHQLGRNIRPVLAVDQQAHRGNSSASALVAGGIVGKARNDKTGQNLVPSQIASEGKIALRAIEEIEVDATGSQSQRT